MCGFWIRQHLLLTRWGKSGQQWQDNLCFDDFHSCAVPGAADRGALLLSAGRHTQRIDSQYKLQKGNEFLAAGVKRYNAITSFTVVAIHRLHFQV